MFEIKYKNNPNKKYYNTYKDNLDSILIKDLKNESLLIDQKNIYDLIVENCKNCSFTFKKEGMVINFKNCDLNSVYLENINTENEEDYCEIAFTNCNVYSLIIKKGLRGFLFEDTTVEKIVFENIGLWRDIEHENVSFERNLDNLENIDSTLFLLNK